MSSDGTWRERFLAAYDWAADALIDKIEYVESYPEEYEGNDGGAEGTLDELRAQLRDLSEWLSEALKEER
jgi:hypothetical protein